MRRAIIVGLTGPTGAGKSTVAELFKKYGYAVIDADKVAALVTEKGSKTLAELAKGFGQDIINTDGTLNRELLAQRAFAGPSETHMLNEITHPEIIRLMLKRVNGEFFNGYEAVILDASQLFESHLNDKCALVISVTAPKELRLQRIRQRDSITEELIQKRMNAQLEDEFFIQNSDIIIENTGDLEELKNKVRFAARMIEEKIGQ